MSTQTSQTKYYFEKYSQKYISDADKQLKREHINRYCVAPFWKGFFSDKDCLELGGVRGFLANSLKERVVV